MNGTQWFIIGTCELCCIIGMVGGWVMRGIRDK